MSSIILSGLGWNTPDGRPVFRELDLRFSRERVGLVGRNGVGKTALLHVLAGLRPASAGSFRVEGVVTLFQQAVDTRPGETIADLFGARSAMAILARAEQGLASIEELAEADWTLEERVQEALSRVELAADLHTPLRTLSGGQRTRAGLASAIFAQPDFLLLDEPTNNLDQGGREAVLAMIKDWKTGLIVVSHDRDLLERVDAIVEMTSLGARRYGGNWSHYRQQKAIELVAAEHDLAHAERRQVEIARKAQVAEERQQRRDAAGSRKAARGDMPRILLGARKNAAQASGGSGRRMIERQTEQAAAHLSAARAKVEFLQQLSIVLPSTGLAADRVVLDLGNVTGGYESTRPVFSALELRIVGPERVALVGPNGVGKSTVLKTIVGELPPLAGHVRLNATLALLDQQVSFLDRSASILDNYRRLNPGADDMTCRQVLAGFLFRADAALEMVGALSGGQMLRAGLACRLGAVTPPELLILDEPTNHLDLESIAAIETALQAFDGALLVVSHDHAFLDNIGIARRIALDDGGHTGAARSRRAAG